MFVQIKREKKKIKVEVSERDCPLYACFSPHHYQHLNYNPRTGSVTYADDFYSCSHRNYHGCPDVKIKKEKKT